MRVFAALLVCTVQVCAQFTNTPPTQYAWKNRGSSRCRDQQGGLFTYYVGAASSLDRCKLQCESFSSHKQGCLSISYGEVGVSFNERCHINGNPDLNVWALYNRSGFDNSRPPTAAMHPVSEIETQAVMPTELYECYEMEACLINDILRSGVDYDCDKVVAVGGICPATYNNMPCKSMQCMPGASVNDQAYWDNPDPCDLAPPTPAPPTLAPTALPTAVPTAEPSAVPTAMPTPAPSTVTPTASPTAVPTAVPTSSPATSAPSTTAPATQPPATLPGATQAPTTAAPDTSAPAIPPTQPPTTAAPRTSAPTTAQPKTLAPLKSSLECDTKDIVLNEEFRFSSTEVSLGCKVGGLVYVNNLCTILVKDKECDRVRCLYSGEWSVPQCTGANGVSGGMKGIVNTLAGASPKGPGAAVMVNLACKVEDLDLDAAEPLDWEFHPIGVPIGKHEHRYFVGAIVFNFLLLLAILLFLCLLALIQQWTAQIPFMHALGNVRAPGLLYVPYFFFLPGLSLSSAHMAFNMSKAPTSVAVFGWIMLVLLMVVPFLVWYFILSSRNLKAMTVPDPRITKHTLLDEENHEIKMLREGTWGRKVYIFIFGTNIWVSTEGRFVWHWGAVFESFKYSYQWFPLVDMGQILGLCMFASWQTSDKDTCLIRNLLITLILTLYLLAVLLIRPYLALFENVIQGIIASLMLIAMIIMTIAMRMNASTNREELYNAAGVILIVITFLVAFKALYDLVTFVWDMRVGRRRKVQEADLARVLADGGFEGEVLDEMKENTKIVELMFIQSKERRADPDTGEWKTYTEFASADKKGNEWKDAPHETRVDVDGNTKPFSGFVSYHPTVEKAANTWDGATEPAASVVPPPVERQPSNIPIPKSLEMKPVVAEFPSSVTGLGEPLLAVSSAAPESEPSDALSELADSPTRPLSAWEGDGEFLFYTDDHEERASNIARSRRRPRSHNMHGVGPLSARASLPLGFYADVDSMSASDNTGVNYLEQPKRAPRQNNDGYFHAVPMSPKRKNGPGGGVINASFPMSNVGV